jgi:hypothetical protein
MPHHVGMINTVTQLRLLLRDEVGHMKDSCTMNSLPKFCTEFGLPVPPEGGDKRGRLHAAFDMLADEDVPTFAAGLIAQGKIGGALRGQVQDVLWSHLPLVEIPKRSRRDIARALDTTALFRHWPNFELLLKDVFIIEDGLHALLGEIITGHRDGVLEYVQRHFVRNPEDANVEELFDKLKALDIPHRRFGLFLERLVSADVQVNVEAQEQLVSLINPVLHACGAELRQVGEDGGYPTYGLVARGAPRGRPKNIIFASPRKPDIRFRDAVNNDIEIASNADDVLVYDRPLTAEGLRWGELQRWWAELTSQPDAERAKRTLYKRLSQSLPDSSPPQKLLFRCFFEAYGAAIPQLPALLPEVWLHWDPKSVSDRGVNALLNHRMDFLMLLPGGIRVVIEVDGKQHFADDSGRADTAKYAKMAAGDRDLRLSGYDVYRFGGVELQGEGAARLVKVFFDALFTRHGVVVP